MLLNPFCTRAVLNDVTWWAGQQAGFPNQSSETKKHYCNNIITYNNNKWIDRANQKL